jgi:hypothetical protein
MHDPLSVNQDPPPVFTGRFDVWLNATRGHPGEDRVLHPTARQPPVRSRDVEALGIARQFLPTAA